MKTVFREESIILKYFLFILIFSTSIYSQSPESKIEEGKNYFITGKFDDAKRSFIEAVSLSRISGNKLQEAIAYKFLGNLYSPSAFNIPDTAYNYYDISLSILDKIENKNVEVKTEIANVENNFGLLLHEEGNFDRAITKFQNVLSIDKELGNTEGEMKTLNNLGRAFRDRGLFINYNNQAKALSDFNSSLEYFNQSINIKQTGENLANRGRTNLLLQKNNAALNDFIQSKNIYSSEGNLPWQATILGNIGIVLEYLAYDKYSEAALTEEPSAKLKLEQESESLILNSIDSLKTSIEIIEQLRGNIGSESSRSTFFDNKITYYENLIRLLISNNQTEEAFFYVEKAKARSFLDQLSGKEIKLSGSQSKEVIELVEKEKSFANRISYLLQFPDSGAALQKSIKDYENIINELNTKAPDYVSLKSGQPLRVNEVQNYLDDETALIEFFIGNNFSVVFYIDNKKTVSRLIDFQTFNLYESIEKLRADLLNYNRQIRKSMQDVQNEEMQKNNRNWFTIWKEKWSNTKVDDSFQWTLFTIYGFLFGNDFPALMSQKENLIIIPHGILHHLPFNALISSMGNLDMTDYKHLPRPKYLIEEKRIVMLPSASTLKFIQKENNKDYTKAMIVGNPDYPTRNWASLPGAEKEAKTISVHFENPTLLLKSKATETLVKETALNYKLLHFATHGEYDNNVLKSKLLFTKTEVDDGYLTVDEIFDLELNANLIVLSACQTGQVGGLVKDQLPSGDDLVGLTRAFVYAGTPSIIATLWFVDDASTSRIMEEFYINLIDKKLSKSEALRLAQISILNDSESLDWSHPFFWAPTILIGNGK